MFKHSTDEEIFLKMVRTYFEEFGEDNVIIFLPKGVIPLDLGRKVKVRTWRDKRYGITHTRFSAYFYLTPED